MTCATTFRCDTQATIIEVFVDPYEMCTFVHRLVVVVVVVGVKESKGSERRRGVA